MGDGNAVHTGFFADHGRDLGNQFSQINILQTRFTLSAEFENRLSDSRASFNLQTNLGHGIFCFSQKIRRFQFPLFFEFGKIHVNQRLLTPDDLERIVDFMRESRCHFPEFSQTLGANQMLPQFLFFLVCLLHMQDNPFCHIMCHANERGKTEQKNKGYPGRG